MEKKKANYELTKCIAAISHASGNDIDDDAIPPSLKAILDYWDVHSNQAGGKKVCSLLSKHLRANFTPENVAATAKILESMNEVVADKVEVTGFNFDGTTNIPSINAQATFTLPFKKKMSAEKLAEWEEKQDDTLAFCVNFYWEFEDIDDEDWESWLEDSSGIEFSIIDEAS